MAPLHARYETESRRTVGHEAVPVLHILCTHCAAGARLPCMPVIHGTRHLQMLDRSQKHAAVTVAAHNRGARQATWRTGPIDAVAGAPRMCDAVHLRGGFGYSLRARKLTEPSIHAASVCIIPHPWPALAPGRRQAAGQSPQSSNLQGCSIALVISTHAAIEQRHVPCADGASAGASLAVPFSTAPRVFPRLSSPGLCSISPQSRRRASPFPVPRLLPAEHCPHSSSARSDRTQLVPHQPP